MSRNPHLLPAERRKRVQVQNCIEDKFLRQKLDSISKEKHYIDKELRRISLAKESLLESLDRFNSIPRSTHKRLSLPCLRDGPKKEHETTPICASIPPLEALPHQALKNRQRQSRRSCDQSVFQNRKDEQSIEGKYEQQRKVDRLQRAQGVSEFRVASPVTASLILSGQINKNKTASERTTCTSRGNIAAKAKQTRTPLRLPEVTDTPTRSDLNPTRKAPTGQYCSQDGMLATNLKSKFRQIGSIVMATAILRNADEKKKSEKH